MANRTALVVEDSATMRHLISFALRRVPGLAFVEAENGQEALELLEKRDVDLILLDLNMPVMNGFGFLERLAARDKPMPPVVVITTEGAQPDIDQAFELGAKAYVTKPVQAASLSETIARVLAGDLDGSVDVDDEGEL
ncbi:MAG: response regulator [Myxococcales bacterium]|nr:response regulator [Myxococcales bacterium]